MRSTPNALGKRSALNSISRFPRSSLVEVQSSLKTGIELYLEEVADANAEDRRYLLSRRSPVVCAGESPVPRLGRWIVLPAPVGFVGSRCGPGFRSSVNRKGRAASPVCRWAAMRTRRGGFAGCRSRRTICPASMRPRRKCPEEVRLPTVISRWLNMLQQRPGCKPRRQWSDRGGRPGLRPLPLNKGRGVNPGDSRSSRRSSRASTTSALNKGRGVNPGDSPTRAASRSFSEPSLNEGRGVNPGDRSSQTSVISWIAKCAQQRPGRKPRRQVRRVLRARGAPGRVRSTKAGA